MTTHPAGSFVLSFALHGVAALFLLWFLQARSQLEAPSLPAPLTLVNFPASAVVEQRGPRVELTIPRAPAPEPLPVVRPSKPSLPSAPPSRAPRAISSTSPRSSTSQPSATPPRAAPVPRVQESFSFPDQTGPTRVSTATSTDFAAALLHDIRAAVGTVNETASLAAATVVFALQADGSLGRARVVRSSGSAALDAAVLAACARVRARDFPRELIGQEHEIVFHPTASGAH